MSAVDDRLSQIVAARTLPGRLTRETAGHAAAANGVTFDQDFYETVRAGAAHWQSRAGAAVQAAVLVPAGLWALGAGFTFPDRDISILGIGSHRFSLFHSGISVWVLRKLYEAHLARRDNAMRLQDRVVRRLWVSAGPAWPSAWAVTCSWTCSSPRR
jgi:hypothetical protein